MSFFSLFNVSSSIPSLPHLSSRFSTADLFFFHVFLYYFPFFTSSLVFLTVLSFLPFSNYFFFTQSPPHNFFGPFSFHHLCILVQSLSIYPPSCSHLVPVILTFILLFFPPHILFCPSIHPAFLFLPFNIAFLLPSFCFSHGYFSFVFLAIHYSVHHFYSRSLWPPFHCKSKENSSACPAARLFANKKKKKNLFAGTRHK